MFYSGVNIVGYIGLRDLHVLLKYGTIRQVSGAADVHVCHSRVMSL